jgi:hypothetical protein
MTMSEFKKLVKDVDLETRDFKFDVMQNARAASLQGHTHLNMV